MIVNEWLEGPNPLQVKVDGIDVSFSSDLSVDEVIPFCLTPVFTI